MRKWMCLRKGILAEAFVLMLILGIYGFSVGVSGLEMVQSEAGREQKEKEDGEEGHVTDIGEIVRWMAYRDQQL